MTGISRRSGIAAGIARRLAVEGWDLGLTWWLPADEGMPWAGGPDEPMEVADELVNLAEEVGRPIHVTWHQADLAEPEAPAAIFRAIEAGLGPVSALVNCHARSRSGGIFDTSAADFDAHMAVNARATLLMIREFAHRLPEGLAGRVVNLTSDAVHGEVAYGASKAALDRITVAAAVELAPRGITVNAVNPGPNDTGWMTDEVKRRLAARTPSGRVGQPTDAAALIAFLCSEDAGWITGQVLHSDGGFSVAGRPYAN